MHVLWVEAQLRPMASETLAVGLSVALRRECDSGGVITR
mgnify:CR=1 FL=1